MMGPTTIGRYRLIKRIGAGGMGVVYEAVDSRDERRVALKVLLPHAAEEAEGLLRFKREFRALARLRHPNIVRVHDAGLENDVPFIAMEFLKGRDVRRHLRAIPEGPMRDRELRRCLRQIFGALAHIHVRRIVHRDLKPENILVTDDGRVKLMDFGVARLLRSPTSSSGLLGTFAYMAPEQVTSGEIDGRSDLYAIGILMYEVLSGDYPFPVEPPAAALHHHVNTLPEPITEKNPKADPSLAALAHKLLEKDPMDRLQTAEEAFQYLADDDSLFGPLEPSLPGQLFTARFAGRRIETDLLDRVVKDAEIGRGRLILIEGPSGVGKTRLLLELRSRTKRRTHVLLGQCTSDRSVAYGPIQAILDDIASIASRAPSDVTRKIMGRDTGLVHAVSNRLADLAGPATADHLDPSERKLRLHKAIVGVIGRLALTRSVLLVIDDLHWADSSTLELLWDAARTLLAPRPNGAVGETVCPVAIVLTRRSLAEGPDQSEMLIRRLDENRSIERLHLGPLDVEAVAEMVRTMTGVQRAQRQAIDEIMRATHGRPLMVQDMLQSWVDEGALVRRKGTWLYRDGALDAGPDDSGPVFDPHDSTNPEERAFVGSDAPGVSPIKSSKPRGDDAMLAKLGKLTDEARALLEKLALLGRLLSAEIVSAVAGQEEEAFLDAIDELVRANLLVEDVSHLGVRYRFYHEGFREAVARALHPNLRTELHLFIAERLEKRFRDRHAELAHVLARHFRHGGKPERAIRYLRMTASSAAARGDLDAAMRRLSDAVAIIDDRPRTPAHATRRLQILVLQIDLLLDFGRPREALDRADPEASMAARDPRVMRAELMLRRAACQFALGKLDECLATLGRMPSPAPTRSLGARSLELEGRARVSRGEYAQARAVLQAAHDIARTAGLLELAYGLDAKIGMVLLHQGDFGGALVKLETGLERARSQGASRMVSELLGHIGMIHASRANNTAALACFREAIEIAEARGVRADLERWSGELGKLMTDLGDFDGALGKLRQALEIARETGSRQGEATWRAQLGIHHMRAGHPELAVSELTRCLAISREIGFSLYEGWARIHLGALEIERSYDNFDEAFEHIEAGLEIGHELDNRELQILGLLHLARVRRAAGDHAKAKSTLEDADHLAIASEHVRLRTRIQVELAGLD
jgi:tetratricopeptide (TPR) repeat protein